MKCEPSTLNMRKCKFRRGCNSNSGYLGYNNMQKLQEFCQSVGPPREVESLQETFERQARTCIFQSNTSSKATFAEQPTDSHRLRLCHHQNNKTLEEGLYSGALKKAR